MKAGAPQKGLAFIGLAAAVFALVIFSDVDDALERQDRGGQARPEADRQGAQQVPPGPEPSSATIGLVPQENLVGPETGQGDR